MKIMQNQKHNLRNTSYDYEVIILILSKSPSQWESEKKSYVSNSERGSDGTNKAIQKRYK